MNSKSQGFSKAIVGLGLVLGLAFTAWWSMALKAADEKPESHQSHANHNGHHALHLNHIQTQAEAEALKPGDSIAMACSMCKHVMVHPVTKDKSHVKMMTIGQKHKCAACGGTVTVEGTGKGRGKHEKVKHVCSKCGDDVMFACATKPGSGTAKHQHHRKGEE